MTNQSAKLGTVPIPKLILRVSLPIAISSTIQALYNIVDGIYVASICEDALTATSLFFSVNMIMVAISSGMAAGLNTLLSFSLGSKQSHRASEIVITGLLLAFVMSVFFALCGYYGAPVYYSFFETGASITEYGVAYMQICTSFFLPSALSFVLERILQAANHASLSMIAQMTGAIVNIILDPILIFGKFGLPAMGIRGAAIATVLGQTIAALLALIFIKTKIEDFRLSFRHYRFHFSTVVDIYRVGLPVSLMQVIGTIMTFSINKILMMFSAAAVTVFGIYYKIQMFVFMQIFAFGQGNLTIVAFNRGARLYSRVRKSIRCTIIVNVLIGTIGMLVFQFYTDPLLTLFHPTQEVLILGRHALRVISVIFPIEAVCVTFSYSFQGLGHGGLSLIHSFIRQLMLRVPFAYLLAALFGLDAVWYSFIIAEIAALFLTSYLYYTTCRKELQKPDGTQ